MSTSSNPIALRLNEASLALEGGNIPEIVAILEIAANEINRLQDLFKPIVVTVDALNGKKVSHYNVITLHISSPTSRLVHLKVGDTVTINFGTAT